jgi:hypothetical protein
MLFKIVYYEKFVYIFSLEILANTLHVDGGLFSFEAIINSQCGVCTHL